jgi:hypothetical protein
MTTSDPEKKKYFKIQANHVAPPGSQYSKESVKRKRTEQEVSTQLLKQKSVLTSLEIPKNSSNQAA